MPRANPDLLGQEEAETTLFSAYAGGHLAHAWLLGGPRGIGKATLAFRFARFLLAAGDGDTVPASTTAPLFVSPDHPVFRRVVSGGHADLITIERTVNDRTGKLRSEIVVDDVRRIADFFAHTAAEGGWRVAVVDGAEDMNRNAANAILKILEEPPDRAVLMLVSHNPGRLLATIRSRCRRLTLRPLADPTVASLLARWRPDLSPAEIEAAVRLADGSVGRALTELAAGVVDLHATLVSLLAGLPHLDIVGVSKLGDRLAKTGAEEQFSGACELFRRTLAAIVRRAAGAPPPSLGRAEEEIVARLAAAASLDRWLEVWEKTESLLARADSLNLDRKQIVLTLFVAVRNAIHV